MFRYTAFTLIIFVLSLFLPSLVKANEQNYVIIGYYAGWSPPKNFNPQSVTHINYAFADVCWDGKHGNQEASNGGLQPCTDFNGNEQNDTPNGTVVLGAPTTDLPNLDNLKGFKHVNPQLKTLISIGGWSWSMNLSLVARTEETRMQFAESAVAFIRSFDMDGVDLDWEYPVSGGMPNNHHDPSDKKNFTLLLQEIRNSLNQAEQKDGKKYLLTIASSAGFSYLENTELDKVAKIVDYINIMTYDFNGSWSQTTGHNAPLYKDPQAIENDVHPHHVAAAVKGHLDHGVPTKKLVLGLPFYGRSWGNCNPETEGKVLGNGGYQLCSGNGGGNLEPGTYDYNFLEKHIINQNGFQRYWNDTAKVPFLYSEEKREFISYDDSESIKEKTHYITQSALAGAMIWELSEDDETQTLMNSVREGLGLPNLEPSKQPEEKPATKWTFFIITGILIIILVFFIRKKRK
ncbi:glycoside hydrolase family 18 protein [Lederbergia wuyishanensis]|uniref:chitinase n=1 Tax=Lederbergia wuyishanensis TaxID=1347903 RepID=A0ABU0DAN5_9BACI|nr:glycoside hydrolase family 18 protein [Lederbergia wuyishanensis]MCJ8009655.1 glycoside hydrolase family 18 protein [Lederbergia wuyishanensis]MDQ0345471.1 chitinase [Lederbergia wuyishanensis]